MHTPETVTDSLETERQPNAWSSPRRSDLFWGLIAPLLCLLLNPTVMCERLFSPTGWEQQYNVFVYLVLAIGATAVSFVQFQSPPAHAWDAVLAGLLLCCGAIIFGVALLLAPRSIFALRFLVGIFGFIPFITAFVWLRTGAWLLQRTRSSMPAPLVKMSLALSVLVALGIPTVIQTYASFKVSQAVSDILSTEPYRASAAIQTLQSAFWCPITCFDPIALAYNSSASNPLRKDTLAQTYQTITGQDVTKRWGMGCS